MGVSVVVSAGMSTLCMLESVRQVSVQITCRKFATPISCGGIMPRIPVGIVLMSVMACSASAVAAPRTVTLITGDQVIIDGENNKSVNVRPRKGREGIVFSTTYQHLEGQSESLLVIPEDAQSLIAAGRLDQKLFDITELLESKYDDRSRPYLPLVVTYEPRVSALKLASTSLAGAAITTRFKAVNGLATKPTSRAFCT